MTGVLAFPRTDPRPDPTPADVWASVRRSLDKLPLLAARDPAAALLIERLIDNLTPAARGPAAVCDLLLRSLEGPEP
jgi:hypothetical protein